MFKIKICLRIVQDILRLMLLAWRRRKEISTFCSLVGHPFVIHLSSNNRTDRKEQKCFLLSLILKYFIVSRFQKVILITAKVCLKASVSGQPRNGSEMEARPGPLTGIQMEFVELKVRSDTSPLFIIV